MCRSSRSTAENMQFVCRWHAGSVQCVLCMPCSVCAARVSCMHACCACELRSVCAAHSMLCCAAHVSCAAAVLGCWAASSTACGPCSQHHQTHLSNSAVQGLGCVMIAATSLHLGVGLAGWGVCGSSLHKTWGCSQARSGWAKWEKWLRMEASDLQT